MCGCRLIRTAYGRVPAAGGRKVSLKLSHAALWSEPQAPAVGVLNSPLHETVGVDGESVADAGVAAWTETEVPPAGVPSLRQPSTSERRTVGKMTTDLLVTRGS